MSRKMKNLVLLLIIFFLCSFLAIGQSDKKMLNISLVSHEGIGSQDDDLNKLLKQIINETSLGKEYDDVYIRHSGYDDDINFLKKDAIVSFSPTKYIITKNTLKENIIPILIVEKDRNANGFYRTCFVTSKNSNIKDIKADFDAIQTFYFVNKQSTSGYVYALKDLHKLDLIDNPCFCELEKKGKQIYFTNEHKFVQEAVSKDDNAVGATWNPNNNIVETLYLSNNFISQDVIFISANLKQYREVIIDWLKASLIKHPEYFEKSSNRIVGFIDYSTQRDYYYNDLFESYQTVKNADEKICGDKINMFWYKNNKTLIWITLITTLIVSILISIFTWTINKTANKIKLCIDKRKNKCTKK